MIFEFIAGAAFVSVLFFAFQISGSIMHLWKRVRTDTLMQLTGFLYLLNDKYYRKRNVLGSLPDKSGQVAVVTGGARGLGEDVVKILVQCGMRVVIGVRNVEAGAKVAEQLKKEGLPGSVDVQKLDVSSLKSVEEFAKQVAKDYPAVHLLVNNAGIMFGDYRESVDGFELQFATNYLGHFYLTHLMMNSLKRAGENGTVSSRVVNVSSCAHLPGEILFEDVNMKSDYITTAAYAQSKLAQIMFARYLNSILEEQNAKVKVYSVHPGIVDTELFNKTGNERWFQRMLFKTSLEGATSVLHPCLSPDLEDRGGQYCSNWGEGMSNEVSKDREQQKRLFEMSCDMVKVKNFGVIA